MKRSTFVRTLGVAVCATAMMVAGLSGPAMAADGPLSKAELRRSLLTIPEIKAASSALGVGDPSQRRECRSEKYPQPYKYCTIATSVTYVGTGPAIMPSDTLWSFPTSAQAKAEIRQVKSGTSGNFTTRVLSRSPREVVYVQEVSGQSASVTGVYVKTALGTTIVETGCSATPEVGASVEELVACGRALNDAQQSKLPR